MLINYIMDLLKCTDKPVVIFTTGAAGRAFYSILTKNGVKITCFADNSKEKSGCWLYIDGTKL